MSSMLFLNNLKAVCNEETDSCQIKIVTLYNEYKEFKLYACDNEGNIQEKEPTYTVDRVDVQRNSNSISVKRNSQKSMLFKVVPVIIQDGKEKIIQMEPEEKGNVVTIPVLKRRITYNYEMIGVHANCGFLRNHFSKKSTQATLKLSVKAQGNELIKNGELCYVINQIRYPIPAITGSAYFEIPNTDSNDIPVVQAVKNPERYNIQLVRGV